LHDELKNRSIGRFFLLGGFAYRSVLAPEVSLLEIAWFQYLTYYFETTHRICVWSECCACWQQSADAQSLFR
jgi:hypothetical protein